MSGALDVLAKDTTEFHELSRSRLGYYGDEQLADMIFEGLKGPGLARDSKDGVSIPMHPLVRSLILTLLSQILRPYGNTKQINLNPVTDRPRLVSFKKLRIESQYDRRVHTVEGSFCFLTRR